LDLEIFKKKYAMAVAAPMLPAGYVVSASKIADRRMILAGTVGESVG